MNFLQDPVFRQVLGDTLSLSADQLDAVAADPKLLDQILKESGPGAAERLVTRFQALNDYQEANHLRRLNFLERELNSLRKEVRKAPAEPEAIEALREPELEEEVQAASAEASDSWKEESEPVTEEEALDWLRDLARQIAPDSSRFQGQSSEELMRLVEEGVVELQKDLAQTGRQGDEAMESSRMKDQFLANISHEVRVPLNGILGMADLLLDTPLRDDQLDYINTIRAAGKALIRALDDVRDFARLSAGNLEISEEAVNPEACAEETLNSFREIAEKRGLTLRLDVQPGVPTLILSDGVRLRQVLTNLVENAIKFSRSGSVCVRIAREYGSRPMLRFAVEDEGVGIPSERLESLFQPFMQADAETADGFSGTGLGLAISRSLIQLLGGNVGVHSEVGTGSTFFFTIDARTCEGTESGGLLSPQFGTGPADRATPAPDDDDELEIIVEAEEVVEAEPVSPFERLAARTKIVEAELPVQRLRILLAEDNPVNQKVTRLTLERLGHDVEVVDNGREAVEIVDEQKFDLVLMDLEMPEMGGIEAATRIRDSLTEREKPRIIALTGHVFDDMQDRCRQAGMSGFLSKPISLDELDAVLSGEKRDEVWARQGSGAPSSATMS